MALEDIRAALYRIADSLVDIFVASVKAGRRLGCYFSAHMRRRVRHGQWWVRLLVACRWPNVGMCFVGQAGAVEALYPWYPSGRRRDRGRPARLTAASLFGVLLTASAPLP